MNVATEILNQLGGNKFIAMTGSKNFGAGENKLSMHLARNNSGAKYLTIELNGDDTYTMTFAKMKNYAPVVVKEFTGVYNEKYKTRFKLN